MKFELVELPALSGPKCAIYSVLVDDDQDTLVEHFVQENRVKFKTEVDDILSRIKDMAHKHGAAPNFFKLKEGMPGDDVCALYDDPDSNLRLYCIRFGSTAVILGNGGHKPKSIRAFQEDPKLTEDNYLLRSISAALAKVMRTETRTLEFDGDEFEGDFVFYSDDHA